MSGRSLVTDPKNLGWVRADRLAPELKRAVWGWIRRHEPKLAEWLQGPAQLIVNEFGGHIELKAPGLTKKDFTPPAERP